MFYAKDDILPGFAARIFQSQAVFDAAVRTAIGTRMPRTSWQALQEFRVFVPPLEEQRRIAGILDTVDAAIQQTDELIAKLQQVKAGLLHDMLTRGLDEAGRLRDPEAHPEQFKETALGRLPAGWEIAPLEVMRREDTPHIKTGPFGSSLKSEHWTDQGVPVITIGALGEGRFIESELLFVSKEKAQSLAAYAVRPGDLVFSRVADVGRSVVVSRAEDGWIMSSNLMRISLDQSKVVPAFVHLNIVHSEMIRSQIRRFVNAGGRDIANTGIMNSLQFPWPQRGEQARITEAVAAYDDRIHAEETYRDKLTRLKQGLMQDLLAGRVRTTDVALNIFESVDSLKASTQSMNTHG